MIGTMHLLWGPNGVYCRSHEKQRESLRCQGARNVQQEIAQKNGMAMGGLDDFLDVAEIQALGGGSEPEKTSELVARSANAAERAICGTWISNKGQCRISHDRVTDRLQYEEIFSSQDGERLLQGWLMRRIDIERCWQACLSVSLCGDDRGLETEIVGDIEVRLGAGRPPSTLNLRIRVADEDDDWQAPVVFHRQAAKAAAATTRREGRGRRNRGGRVAHSVT